MTHVHTFHHYYYSVMDTSRWREDKDRAFHGSKSSDKDVQRDFVKPGLSIKCQSYDLSILIINAKSNSKIIISSNSKMKMKNRALGVGTIK